MVPEEAEEARAKPEAPIAPPDQSPIISPSMMDIIVDPTIRSWSSKALISPQGQAITKAWFNCVLAATTQGFSIIGDKIAVARIPAGARIWGWAVYRGAPGPDSGAGLRVSVGDMGNLTRYATSIAPLSSTAAAGVCGFWEGSHAAGSSANYTGDTFVAGSIPSPVYATEGVFVLTCTATGAAQIGGFAGYIEYDIPAAWQ